MCIPERKNLHNWRLTLCEYQGKRPSPWLEALSYAVRAQAGRAAGWGHRGGRGGCLHTGDLSRELVHLGPGEQASRCWSADAGRERSAGALCCGTGAGYGHETHRGSRLGAARAHRPERRQLPRSARSHRGWWGSLGHTGAGVRAEKPKTSPGHSCFAKSSQVVTTGGKSGEDTRPARPVATVTAGDVGTVPSPRMRQKWT